MGKYYIAFGSNLNIVQMKARCNTAKLIGMGYLKNFRLKFIGVATVVPQKRSKVPIVVWEIQDADEVALDKYEGVHNNFYLKETMKVELEDGKKVEGLIYILNVDRDDLPPSRFYLDTIFTGYLENKLNVDYLLKSYQESCNKQMNKK